MGFKLSRFVISPTSEFQQYDLTFPLSRDPRKVIHGIVTDECGNPLECAIVKFFKVEGIEYDPVVQELVPDPCETCDLIQLDMQ